MLGPSKFWRVFEARSAASSFLLNVENTSRL